MKQNPLNMMPNNEWEWAKSEREGCKALKIRAFENLICRLIAKWQQKPDSFFRYTLRRYRIIRTKDDEMPLRDIVRYCLEFSMQYQSVKGGFLS